jgi:hypothetical protein
MNLSTGIKVRTERGGAAPKVFDHEPVPLGHRFGLDQPHHDFLDHRSLRSIRQNQALTCHPAQ